MPGSNKVSFKPIEDLPSDSETNRKQGSSPFGAATTSPRSSFLRRKKSNSPKTSASSQEANSGDGGILIQEESKSQSTQRSSWRTRRGSLRGSIKNSKKGDSNNRRMDNSTATSDVDDDPDDPVMELFKSRNTQKVRFALGDGEAPRERGKLQRQNSGPLPKVSSSPEKTTSSSTSSFNIKKFMKGALFGSNSKSSSHHDGTSETDDDDDDDEQFDLELQKEMQAAGEDMVWSSTSTTNPQGGPTATDDSNAAAAVAANVLRTQPDQLAANAHKNDMLDESFFQYGTEETRGTIIKLLNKARRAHFLHYRYTYAIKCYVKSIELLKSAGFPDDHGTVLKTVQSLRAAHLCNSAYTNSANIVKLGIKYEDNGEWVRALKMYTIAYRIRRDNLGRSHPSLVVLLNMLGSIQIKRGEYNEAMAIYELALRDTSPTTAQSYSDSSGGETDNGSTTDKDPTTGQPQDHDKPFVTNFLTRSVTYREMGTIHEKWGETDLALTMYHKSLDCMAEYKGLVVPPPDGTYDNHEGGGSRPATCFFEEGNNVYSPPVVVADEEEKAHPLSNGDSNNNEEQQQQQQQENLDESMSESMFSGMATTDNKDANDEDELNCSKGENMELTFETPTKRSGGRHKNNTSIGSLDATQTKSRYDIFFPATLETKKKKKRLGSKKHHHEAHGGGDDNDENKKGDYTDVDVALTIHQIAQLHRSQQEYNLALPAFNVSLRGMKYALGKSHPNVAAILGNIGNLQKEMGDMNGAYSTYQQVLAIESYRLGLSHPDVVVTLHNIATIDAARGNHDHALSLYTQVVGLQRKLFGEDHESVAVTSACMGDVYERLGDTESAVDCYEEALRIKIAALGRHSLEVARLLHKLGKLAVKANDYHLAQSYISKAALVYKLNKLTPDDAWVVDVNRDSADVDAAIALGRAAVFEC